MSLTQSKKIKDHTLFRREGGFLKISEKGVEILNEKGDTYAYIVSENKIEALKKEMEKTHA
jgi:hypothetical protein|nr:MAG TPA: hypothetical protein [Caudoviricetes sp.]